MGPLATKTTVGPEQPGAMSKINRRLVLFAKFALSGMGRAKRQTCFLNQTNNGDAMTDQPKSGLFHDDGTEINPNLITKPSLCVSCRKDDDHDEEILCTLTRADQQGEEDFECFAFEPKF